MLYAFLDLAILTSIWLATSIRENNFEVRNCDSCGFVANAEPLRQLLERARRYAVLLFGRALQKLPGSRRDCRHPALRAQRQQPALAGPNRYFIFGWRVVIRASCRPSSKVGRL